MTSRLAFAVVVPVLALVLFAVGSTTAVGVLHAGNACSTHDGQALRWIAAGEIALVQLSVGVLCGMAAALTTVLLRRRMAALGVPWHGHLWFETPLVVGLVLMVSGAILKALGCDMSPFSALATGLHGVGLLLFLAALIALVGFYIKGIAGRAN